MTERGVRNGWRWYAGALLVLSVAATSAYLPTERLLLDRSCELDGAFAKLKAAAQGRSFWERQLRALEVEIDRRVNETPLQEEMQRILAEHEALVEEYSKRYPELRTQTRAPSAADQLRAQADALDEAEMHAWLEESRREDIEELRRCVAILTTRLSR